MRWRRTPSWRDRRYRLREASFIVRGPAAKAYEAGIVQRVVVIEFESVDKAVAAHDSAAYQEALKALGKDAVERDMRIVEGV